ncbi:fumarylacetoacetate hydrolase, putative, partial [Sulfitobacter indolifex HEL-45]
VCIDMTRRRLLETETGPNAPWELKKSFDHSAPCSEIYPVSQVGHRDTGRISLTVDGEIRQDSDLELMIWKTPEIIATLSKYYALQPGDIIMAGTPDGVGPVVPGNTMVGAIEGLGELTVQVGELV